MNNLNNNRRENKMNALKYEYTDLKDQMSKNQIKMKTIKEAMQSG